MKYPTEESIKKVIIGFEAGTIEHGIWGHPEHLLVAYHYSKDADFDAAYKLMKDGIFNLLNAFEVDLAKEMPYHETLTVFWLKVIHKYANAPTSGSLVRRMHTMITRFDKDYPLRFYSRDFLFSDKARKEYVEGDLRKLK